jgi:hypothetical protein
VNFKTNVFILWVGLVVAGLGQTVALAQEPPAEPNWSVIRRSPFAGLDRGTAQRWLESTIRQLWAVQDVRAAQTQGKAFYQTLMEHYRAGDATAAFREGIAETLASVFTDLYTPDPANRQPPRPLSISYVLMVLRDFAQPSGVPAFLEALRDPTPGPRFVAAEGIAAIQGTLTDPQWTALIPEIQQAASRESNGVVLDRMYRILLAGATGARAGTIAETLRATLDARLEAFAEGAIAPQEADGLAIDWLGERVARENNTALRLEMVDRAGRLLVYAVDLFIHREPAPLHRQQREELIISAERQLEALVRSVEPDAALPTIMVRVAMLEGGAQRDARMESALGRWIGTPDTPGTLNNEPFNLPVGLGIARDRPVSPADAP